MRKSGAFCSCTEATFEKNGQTVAVGLTAHNCQYIAQRNAMIPAAISFANEKYQGLDMLTEPSWFEKDEQVQVSRWTRAFVRRMDKLVAGKMVEQREFEKRLRDGVALPILE